MTFLPNDKHNPEDNVDPRTETRNKKFFIQRKYFDGLISDIY